MRSKNKSCSSEVSSYQFIRAIAKVLKSGIDSTFTVAIYGNKNGCQNRLKIEK